MNIKKLKIENFRNIDSLCIEPSEKMNVFFGENAQGKTNILEAVWLFCGSKSFRGSKDTEMLSFGKNFFKNEIEFFDGERDNTLKIAFSDKKEVYLNEVKKKGMGSIMGAFKAVVFTPDHLSLVKDGPEERRKFLDVAICQIKKGYVSAYQGYNKALIQRNNLLKDIPRRPDLLDTLFLWDEEIAKYGTVILKARYEYLKEINCLAKKYYSGISDEKENFRMSYLCSAGMNLELSEAEIYKSFLKALEKTRKEDVKKGVTSVGPHRDDVNFYINDVSAKSFASQGQQRSIVLTLKLSEGEYIFNKTGKKPVYLLDDVLSELDEKRQSFILNNVKDSQVFITCCDISSVLRLSAGKVFQVKNGFTELFKDF